MPNIFHRLGQLNYEQFPEDPQKWFHWFYRAAELGDAPSAFWIGYFYHQGVGVPESFDVAMEWLRKACDGGSKEAMHYVAILLLDNSTSMYNPQKALDLLNKAIEEPEPNADAAYLLGDIYLQGNDLVESMSHDDFSRRFLCFCLLSSVVTLKRHLCFY